MSLCNKLFNYALRFLWPTVAILPAVEAILAMGEDIEESPSVIVVNGLRKASSWAHGMLKLAAPNATILFNTGHSNNSSVDATYNPTFAQKVWKNVCFSLEKIIIFKCFHNIVLYILFRLQIV